MKSRISKDWKPEYSRDSKDYDDYFFAPFSLCMLFSMMYVGRFPSTQSHISFFIPNPIFSVLWKISNSESKVTGNATYSIKTMMSLWGFLSLFLLTRVTFRKRVTQKWQLLQNYFCDALHSFTKQKFAWMMSRNVYCINFLDHREHKNNGRKLAFDSLQLFNFKVLNWNFTLF